MFDENIQRSVRILTDVGDEVPADLCPPEITNEDAQKILEFMPVISTQLRVVGMTGEVIGYDYVAVFKTAEVFGVELDKEKMALLQLAERRIIERSRNRE